MHIGKKKITISALIVVVFVSVIVWAATSYPNAAISFSGIKMVDLESYAMLQRLLSHDIP